MLVKKHALAGALRHLVRLQPSRPATPILGHVRLEADGKTLSLAATDLTTHLRVELPCDGKLASVCLPARSLLDFVKPSGADTNTTVEIQPAEGDNVVVATDGSMIELHALAASDFSTRPGDKLKPRQWRKQAEWDAAEFRHKVGWTILAVGLDETRTQLTGLFFGEHEVVATDGARLHRAPLKGLSAGPVLVPGKSIAALLHVVPKDGRISVGRAGDLLRFRVGAWVLETAVMQEQFPPYRQVIPNRDGEAFHAVVDGGRLRYVLGKLPRRTLGVRMKLNGKLEIATDGDANRSSTVVELLNTTHEGDDFTIGVNPRYVAEAIHDDVVMMRFFDPLSPVVCEMDDGRQSVLMPMRL